MAKGQEELNLELIEAAREGDAKKVKRLLNKGTDVNVCDKDGYTALYIASQAGHTKVVKELIKASADVNLNINKNEGTALTIAALEGNIEVVETLIGANANLNEVLASGVTALILAAREGHKEIVGILLKARVSMDIKNCMGNTALISAAENGHKEIVEMLLIAGADSTIKTIGCQTALDIAKERLGESQEENKAKYQEIIDFLENPPISGYNTKNAYYKVSCPTNTSTTIEEPIIQEPNDIDLAGKEETDSASAW